MNGDEIHLLEQALAAGLLDAKQASMIRSELQMFPGQKVGKLMVQRRLLTEDQLAQLRSGSVKPAEAPPVARPAIDAPSPVREAPKAPVMNQAPMTTNNADAPKPINTAGKKLETAKDMLAAAREWGCSDLHLSVGVPPFVRKFGEVQYLDLPALTAEASEKLNFALLTEQQAKTAKEELQVDFALEIPGLGRHRCNVYRQRTGWDGAYRIIPNKIVSFEALGLPDAVKSLTDYHNGLIIVAGPGGSGKTTTVAAMLELVNRHRHDHVITVEDPVEYVIPSGQCQVTQREIGAHTAGFAPALRAALREDPDIILVGELRDLDTIQIAISASETGHLVLGTLHTNSASRTVARIMDVFPPEQRDQICAMVSKSLRGVICQQLVPRKDGKGVVLALEILIFTSGVSALVREGKTHLLGSAMQAGRKIGMRQMDDSLMELYQAGIISGREAYQRADNKPPFESIKEK